MTGLRRSGGRGEKATLDDEQLYGYAVGLLARQMRTVAQLKRLMRGKLERGGEAEARIEAVIGRLRGHGYLNDEHYAQVFATARKDGRRFGQRRVAQELLQKGVRPEVVAAEVAAVFEGVDEVAQARAFLAKKRVVASEKLKDPKESGRVLRTLVRAGFSVAVASKVLRAMKAPEEVIEGVGELDEG